MDLGIDGRVALVTASSRGLGRASAEALAGRGGRVVVTARGAESLDQTEQELQATGAEVFGIVADVDRPRGTRASGRRPPSSASARSTSWWPTPVARRPAVRSTLDDDAIRAAVESQSAERRPAGPGFGAPHAGGGWGRICCISSYSVVQPLPGLALSNTARVGLVGLGQDGGRRPGRRGQRDHLEPGLSRSPRHRADAELAGGSGGGGPMGDPADFGRVVAFLCSEPAVFVNGAAVVVDGGATLAL